MPAKSFREPASEPRAGNLLARLFLVLLPAVFFWRETLGLRTLGDKDAVFWFFPAYRFVAEQFKSGSLPLWNPYQYSGAPLLAQWQAGVFDPINWIHLLETTSRSLTLSLEIGFAVALLAMFSYARSVGFNRAAALVSAVIYGLSGFTVARTLYPGLLHAVALTPFVLYFVEKLRQEGRRRHVAGGAVIIAWQVFAAHPQPLVYSSLLACAYASFCVLFRRGESESQVSNLKSQIPFLAKFALMFTAGVCLSAVQLLPAAEFAAQSVRRDWSFELFTFNSLHPLSLLTALFPFFHGEGRGIYRMPYWGSYWHHNEGQIYLGALALSLAIAGAIWSWRARSRMGIFWSCAAVAGVILALGEYAGPLARALYHVPVIGNFRSPNRHWMEVSLAVAALAGYAVDRLLSEESRLLARMAQIASASLALLCVAVGAFVLMRKDLAETAVRSLFDPDYAPQGFLQTAGAEFYLPALTALCACAAIVIFARSRRRSRSYALLLALLIFDYHLYAAFAPISTPDRLEPLVGTAIPRALTAEPAGSGPIRFHLALSPASGEFHPFWFYGSEMVAGYDPMLNERYKVFSGVDEAGRSFITTLLDPQDRTLDILNVRYALVAPSFTGSRIAPAQTNGSDQSRWREIDQRSEAKPYRDYRIFENLRSMPRAWLVDRVSVAYEGDQLKMIRGELAGRSFDPRVEALVEPIAEPKNRWYSRYVTEEGAAQSVQAGQAGSVKFLDRSPGHILVEAETPRRSLLVLSEIAYPGWQVKVDGKPAMWTRVNYMLIGTPLPEGKHTVEFAYRPLSIKLGAVVSITTALCLLAIVLWEKRGANKTEKIKVVDAV